MQLTVRFSLVLIVCSSPKPVLTFVANEALDMPLPLESSDDVVHYSLVATATLGGEHFVVIPFAVRFSFKHMVLSSTPGEGFLAVNTYKAVRVPRLLEGSNTSINNRSVAMRASRSELSVVILLTVGHVISFKEFPHPELYPTPDANEVLRVPCLSQCSHHLPDDYFIAS